MRVEWKIRIIDGVVSGTGLLVVSDAPQKDFLEIMQHIDEIVLPSSPSPVPKPTADLIKAGEQAIHAENRRVNTMINVRNLTSQLWSDEEKEIVDKSPDKYIAWERYQNTFPGKRNKNSVYQRWNITRRKSKKIVDPNTDLNTQPPETHGAKTDVKIKPASIPTEKPAGEPITIIEKDISKVEFPDKEHGGDDFAYIDDRVMIISGEMKGKTGKIIQFIEDNPNNTEVLFENGEKKIVDYDSMSFISRPPEEQPTTIEPQTPMVQPDNRCVSIGDTVMLLFRPHAGECGKVKNIVGDKVCIETDTGEIIWPFYNEYEIKERVIASEDKPVGKTIDISQIQPTGEFKINQIKTPEAKAGYKFCQECEKEKPVNEFSAHRSGGEARHGMCKECEKDKVKMRLMDTESEWTGEEDAILKAIPDNRAAILRYRENFPESEKSHQKLGARWRLLRKDDKKLPEESPPETPPVETPAEDKKLPTTPKINDTVEIIKGYHNGVQGVVKQINSGKVLIEAPRGLTTWCLIKDEIRIIASPPPVISVPDGEFVVGCKVRRIRNRQLGVGKVVEVRKDTVRVEFNENNIVWLEKKNIEVVIIGDEK